METLNLIGKPCPIPVIEAKKALRAAAPGHRVALLVDNDPACRNLAKMAAGLGHGFQSAAAEGGHILVTLTAGTSAPGTPAPGTATAADSGGGLVVAIGHETLGGGPAADLGKTLMKAFLYSLTELDTLPEYLLFFNGGAFLTTEGSNALEDLKVLEDRGAVISTCGACLNFYQLTEKLKIGAVTNMYAIAATLAQAGKVINL
jgi:selenium metabolism protein YedF